MNIKLIIIIALSYLYGIFEIILGIRQRQRRKRNIVIKGDKGSFWLLLILIAVGYTLSFCFAATRTGRIYHWNALFAVGAIMIIVGLIIRITAIMTLKQHFTYTVTKIENHELIESGLYESIRHPAYLGQMIIFVGTSVSLSNWLSVLSMIIPVVFGFIYRIRVEESFMIEQMGEKYIDYQKRTKRLIPTIY
ncbi:MAG: isoprenylcysteine carboxylmethyltransferase family protein [Bacteroidales bacterium]